MQKHVFMDMLKQRNYNIENDKIFIINGDNAISTTNVSYICKTYRNLVKFSNWIIPQYRDRTSSLFFDSKLMPKNSKYYNDIIKEIDLLNKYEILDYGTIIQFYPGYVLSMDEYGYFYLTNKRPHESFAIIYKTTEKDNNLEEETTLFLTENAHKEYYKIEEKLLESTIKGRINDYDIDFYFVLLDENKNILYSKPLEGTCQ